MNVWIRRAVALLADALLVVAPLAYLALFSLLGLIDFDAKWTAAFWIWVILFFGLWEGLGGGRSPGKLLLGIRVTAEGGGPPSLYQSFLRVSLLLSVSVALELAISLGSAVGFWQQGSISWVVLGLEFVALAFWPISVLFGKGEVGAHDLLAHCRVTRENSAETAERPSAAWVLGGAALAAALTVLVLAYPMHRLFGGVLSTAASSAETRQGAELWEDLQAAIQGVGDRVDPAGLYHASVQVLPSRWEESYWDDYTFAESVLGPGGDLKEETAGFRAFADCRIQVSWKGLLSSEFQRLAARQIAAGHRDPGVLFEFNFFVPGKVPLLDVTLHKKLIGYWEATSRGLVLKLREPDEFAGVSIGVRTP